MPEPNYQTQIAVLAEMVLDLYVKHNALAAAFLQIASNRDDLRELEKEVWAEIGDLQPIKALIEKVDVKTLEDSRVGRDGLRVLVTLRSSPEVIRSRLMCVRGVQRAWCSRSGSLFQDARHPGRLKSGEHAA